MCPESERLEISFRNATRDDLTETRLINEAVVPAVNSLSVEELGWFLEHAPWFRVATNEDRVLGMLIGFFEDSSYASENYRWFASNYARFAYVDRVAVHDDARRLGIATRLYEDFIDGMPPGVPLLTCEVNTRPANPGSLRFHERLGFEQVGSQETGDGEKEVALLAKRLAAAT